MRPPGFVVSCPDTAIAVHTNVRSSGKHENSLIRRNFLKGLSCCTGHVIAKKIVHLIMTDSLSLYLVIKAAIVLRVIAQVLQFLGNAVSAAALVLCISVYHVPKFFFTLFRVENCRLIHVIPKAFDSLRSQNFIFTAKPLSCLWIQHIRKMGPARPYGSYKFFAVFLLTEIPLGFSLFVDIISILNFYPGINNGNQMDVLGFHFIHKCLEVREILFIYCKVFEGFHVVNIHVQHIHRNVIFSVLSHHFTEILCCLIAPAALSETKSKFRRNIASSDDFTELFHNIVGRSSFYDIKVQIRIFTGDIQTVLLCIANVKSQSRRVIHKHTKGFFPGYDNKIVRAVQRLFVFCVLRVIGTVTYVNKTTLIDASVRLSQPIHHVLFLHFVSKPKSFFQINVSVLRHSFRTGNVPHNRLCFKRLSKLVFLNHCPSPLHKPLMIRSF